MANRTARRYRDERDKNLQDKAEIEKANARVVTLEKLLGEYGETIQANTKQLEEINAALVMVQRELDVWKPRMTASEIISLGEPEVGL